MSIDIGPIDLSAEKAVMSLHAVVDSLGSMERQLLSAAEKTGAGKAATERLGAAFLEGRINALQLRSGLQALVGEVPKTADEIRKLATATTQATAQGGRMRAAFASFSSGAGMSAAQQVMGNLVSETGELTRGLTGASAAAGRIGQSLVATLPSFGPIGIALAALVGGVSMITRVEREQQEAMRDTNRLYDARARLGSLSTNIDAQINATAAATGRAVTEQERLNQTLEQERAIRAAQASMMTAADAARRAGGAGTAEGDLQRIRSLTAEVDRAVPFIRQMNMGMNTNVTTQEVLGAITSRNTGLLRQLGLSIEFGTSALSDQTAAALAANQVAVRGLTATRDRARAEADAAQAAVAAARQMRGGRAAIEASVNAAEAARRANVALAAAERDLGAATDAAARASRDHATSLKDEEAALAETARKAGLQAQHDHREAQRAAAASGPSASDMQSLRTNIGLMLEQARLVGVRSTRTREAITAMQELEMVERRLDTLRNAPRTFQNETRYLELLTRQVALRQEAFDAEQRIRAAEQTARDADAARQRESVSALLDAERARISLAQTTRNEVKAAEATSTNDARAALRTKLNDAKVQAEAIRNGPVELLKSSAESLSQSVSAGFLAAIQNGENVGEAIRKALEASLFSLATQSLVKAVYETAQGFGALALGSPTAALHFKAAGLYAATAAGAAVAGVGVGALGASATGGATAGAAGAPPDRGLGTGPGAAGGGTLPPVTINYNAPVIGGRDAASWETGARMGRYLSAADARVRRAPALMGA